MNKPLNPIEAIGSDLATDLDYQWPDKASTSKAPESEICATGLCGEITCKQSDCGCSCHKRKGSAVVFEVTAVVDHPSYIEQVRLELADVQYVCSVAQKYSMEDANG